jgi:serine/threonine protein kinase
MKELVGQSLDRYQITSLLGEGGMGAVLKARDVTLQRDVAVKVMHPQFARRPDFRARFLQEARTAARLDHPGIVKVYDFGQAGTHLYIVMEFISGQNLGQMLKDLRASNQWLLLPEAIQLIREVCLALDYAHKHGVFHRDIKPDNIMLKPQPSDELPYQPVVTDLGLAKLAEGGMMTAEGTSMGTPAYMSPEQALGEKTDARSDVYSLGILLYELVVGQLPFRVRSLTEAIRCHTKEPPPPPRSLHPDLPEALEQVILKAIAKNPANRFPDAKALADAVAATVAQAPMASVPPTAVEGAMSLMTRYQQSLVDGRGPSILDEFPSIPSDLSQDRIQILDPEKTTHSIPMRGRRLTIGRAADNDLVLDRPSISRHHARIEFDGTNYQVVDLDSTNGTFVANVKLLPGVPEAWSPDKPLRVGDTWLRLERAQQPSYAGTAMFRPNGTMVEPSMVQRSLGMGRIGIFMEPGELAVDPGGSITASLTILNQGSVVDHFQTSVTGVPADWVPVTPQPVRLMPGAQQAVTVTIQPPRAPQTRAGNYPLAIRVTSQDAPSEVAEVKRTLTVSSYSQFTSELHPQRLHAGKAGRITVKNQGNAQQLYTVTWKDRADELSFEPPRATLTVPEGQAAATEFRGGPRQQQLFGREKQHAFNVQVASPGGEVQTHSGELVSKPRFPAWILPVLLALCLLLAGAAALGAKLLGDRTGTPTATKVADVGVPVTSPPTAVVPAATTEVPVATTEVPPATTEVPPATTEVPPTTPPPVLAPITAANASRIKLLYTLDQPLQETYEWPPRLAFSADSLFLAAASPAENVVYLIRVKDGKLLGKIERPHPIADIALSPSDNNLLVVAAGPSVSVWQAPDGKLMYELQEQELGAWTVAFLPDGRGVGTGGSDGADFWHLEPNRGSHFFGTTTEEVTSIAWAPGDTFIATGHNDGVILLWRFVSGPQEPFDKVVTQQRIVTDLAIYPDGSKLVSASKDGGSSVEMWNVLDREPVRLKEPIQGNSLAFSADGSVLATALWSNQSVRLWDAAKLSLLSVLGGTGYNVAFSPDGLLLATLSAEDRRIQIWGVQE